VFAREDTEMFLSSAVDRLGVVRSLLLRFAQRRDDMGLGEWRPSAVEIP
jgi:hypothetical protein